MWEVSTWWVIATVVGGVWLASFLEYFHLNWEVMAIFSILLLLDFIFWISDAYIKDKQSITSKKAWRWVAKKLTKLCLPLIVILVLKGVGFENLEMVTTTILSILIITEWYSIVGHIYSINTWKELSEIDAFELLLDVILSAFKAKLPNKEVPEDTKEDTGEETKEETKE